MRKINFLFAFLLSMMGATQAWADAFSETFSGQVDEYLGEDKVYNYLTAKGWTLENNRWGFYGEKIYDYAPGNFDPGKETELITPFLIVSGTSDVFQFKCYKNSGAGDSGNLLKVYVSPTKNKGDKVYEHDFTSELPAGSFNTDPFEITGIAAGQYYVIFETRNICLDEFYGFEIINVPQSLVASNVTANSATLSWIAGGSETAWEVSFSTTAGDPDNGTIVSASTTTCELSGLTAETTYYAYVRAAVSGQYSGWSNVCEFTPSNTKQLTLNDGTVTNGYVPIYGYYVDSDIQSQFVIPAEDLTTLTGATINKLTFYSSDASVNWEAAEFDVYLNEVESTTTSSTLDISGTRVYAGTLSISDNQMVISFNEDYTYSGGNLQISIDQTKKGSYVKSNWYGISATSGSSRGGNNTLTAQSFLPKVTISYIPSSGQITISAKTIYLKPNADWLSDGARFALYTTTGEVETWVDFELAENEYDIYKAVAPEGTTLMILCRMNPATTENNWNNRWNQTGDITFIKDNTLYTMTDWTNYTTGTYTASTYTMTATGNSISQGTMAFGSVYEATEKSFTLTNTGTGVLKGINITCDNEAFTLSDVPEELAVGATATVKVAFNTTSTEAQTGTVTMKATYAEDVTFAVSGTYVVEAIMEVTATDIGFGIIAADATKTFTIANSGNAALEGINITSDNDAFMIENAPETVAAGESATVTVKMVAGTSYGMQEGTITIGATGQTSASFNVSGLVRDPKQFYVDYRTSDIPKSWDNYTTEEQFEMNGSGGDRNAYSTAALTLLTTSRLIVNEGDKFYFTAKRENSTTYYGDNLSVYYQTTEGTWESSTLISLSASDMSNSEYQVYTLENLPVGDIWLGFNGKYVHIQQMYGLTEPTKTVSLKPTNVWDLADANERYAVYMWKGDGAEKIEDWADFTAIEGVEGCYEATFNDAYTSIILARMNGAAEVNSWNNVWNQTEDVTGENFYDGAIYTITSIDGGNDGKSTYTLGGSTLALSENDEESKVVAGTYDEVTVEFTMGAGKFAAICLPFATTTTDLGEGVKAWAFTGYTDGNIDLSTTTELAAATPYIVYAENGIDGLTFQNVTIASNEAGSVEQGAATFQGSYVKMPAGTMMGMYGVTPAGKIQKAGSGASMKAFRAYFERITQGAKLVCDGEIIGEATGIDTIENAAQTGELYDLQGRRVMNAQKGLYIQNGKKFVVK